MHKWLLVGNELVDTKGQVVDRINCSARWDPKDSKPCALLAQATLDQGHSVLIFCCSKQAGFWFQSILFYWLVLYHDSFAKYYNAMHEGVHTCMYTCIGASTDVSSHPCISMCVCVPVQQHVHL